MPATLLRKRLAQTATLLRKRLWHGCFPVNFVKFLRTPYFYKTLLVADSGNFILTLYSKP